MAVCTICQRHVAILHPMVPSCMPCIMFFQRALTKTPVVCTREKMCFTGPIVYLNCRKCRFDKCLEMGMKMPEKNQTEENGQTVETN